MSIDRPAVLAPADAGYVLPVPPRGVPEVVVVASRRDLIPSLRRGGDVARILGERFSTFAEGQRSFLRELRERLESLDSTIADAPRAQWKGAVHDALAVLDWCDAVQVDLLRESGLASAGAQPIDVPALCEEIANHVATDDQPIVVTGCCANAWWGNAAALADLIRNGLAVLAERTHGVGARCIEVGVDAGVVSVHLTSSGEPGDGVEADSVRRFREALAHVGARARPDGMGPGGAGLIIELPTAAS